MKLYSYQGQEPDRLPKRIRLSDGMTVTSLDELSEDQLISYGFIPVEHPIFDSSSQKCIWNGSEYEIRDFTEEEIDAKKQEEINILTGVDFRHFMDRLKSTSFYKRVRTESLTDLKVNTLYSEFLFSVSFHQKFQNITDYLTKFIAAISFDSKEIEELQNLLNELHLNLIYEIPDDNESYDFEKDMLMKSPDTSTRPFESWVWNGIKWEAPSPYPDNENSYIWNESTKRWNKY